jgi:hypothetical protein
VLQHLVQRIQKADEKREAERVILDEIEKVEVGWMHKSPYLPFPSPCDEADA